MNKEKILKEMLLLHRSMNYQFEYRLDKITRMVHKFNRNYQEIKSMKIIEFKEFLESEIKRDDLNEAYITTNGFRVLSGKIN